MTTKNLIMIKKIKEKVKLKFGNRKKKKKWQMRRAIQIHVLWFETRSE